MKKIINGKKYDTETAKKITKIVVNLGRGNARNFEETLYKKITGEFFLYGKGGPLTKYASTYGSDYGEDIIPLEEDDARFWVEKNCTAPLYEKLFGKVEE